MSFQGRSLDDLPLAAYSTGLEPDELEEASEPEPAPPPMDARAAALSIVEPNVAESPAAAADGGQGQGARRRLPRLPSLPRRRAPAAPPEPKMVAQPLEPKMVAQPAEPKMVAQPLEPTMVAQPQPPRWLAQQQAPRMVAQPQERRVPTQPQAPTVPAKPRGRTVSLRAARLLAGGVIVVGIVILVVVFQGGGSTFGGFAAGPTASPASAGVAAPQGAATITLSGATAGAYSLTGTTGSGRPSDDHLASTWTDSLGSSLTLTGQVSSGTRPTGPDLVLTWTMVIDGTPVTFTSGAGECVVGMGVKPTTLSGSIVCAELTSEDGEVVLEATGTYHT